jgi:hypothetical protein
MCNLCHGYLIWVTYGRSRQSWSERHRVGQVRDGQSRRGHRLGRMDVHGQNLRLQLPSFLLLGFRRLVILLDIELSQQHDGFFSEDAASDWVRLVDTGAEAYQVIVSDDIW